MADVKRFVIIDENGQIVEQTTNMTIEVDAGTTERSVVNKGQLDAVAQAAADALVSEASARSTADTALGDSISSLQSLLADLSSSTSGDLTAVNNRITQEISDRQVADTNEYDRAVAAEGALQTAINDEVTARADAITAEASARDAADVALGLRIDGEAAARATLDTTLRGLIDNEATARATADTNLSNALAQEIIDRGAADTVLQGLIDAEAVARANEDTNLQTAINNEATTRADAVVALQAAIDAEATTRSTADTNLQTAINNEATTRADAVTRLEGLIDAEATARGIAVSNEATTRADADSLLNTAITNEVTRAAAEEDRIEEKFDLAIANEITARQNADDALTLAIANEATRAIGVEGGLRTDLNSEINRATNSEDALATALNNEVARATAEEINVENRAKAYADARVQGLRVKDAVDFAITRFIPAWDEDAEDAVWQPVFRIGEDLTLDGETYPRYTLISDIPGAAEAMHAGAEATDHATARLFYLEVEGVRTLVSHNTSVTVTSDGETRESSLYAHYTQYGWQNWADTQALGYGVIKVLADLVDLTESGVLEAWYTKYYASRGWTTPANARIAIVQNSFANGSYDGQKEAIGSGASPEWAYVDSAEVNAVDAGARHSYMNSLLWNSQPDLGIYQRSVTGGVGTFARAPDFAEGMDVNGAYCITEQGVLGNRNEEINPYGYWYYYNNLLPDTITEPYVGLVFGHGFDGSATSAIVGTDQLVARLFNRVGAYSFGTGLKRDPINPTAISVKDGQGIEASDAYGVSIRLGMTGNLDTSVPDGYHLDFSYNGVDYTERGGIALKGPLVEGPRNSADDYHAHRVLSVDYHIAKTDEEETWQDFNYRMGNTYDMPRAVRASTDAERETDPTMQRVVAANWDSPDFTGVTYNKNDAAIPVSAGVRKDNRDEYSREYFTVRVATAGTITATVFTGYAPSEWALNEILYVGGNEGQFVKYADIPSGKWAIPALKCMGQDPQNHLVYKVLDRPAFLKS